MSIYKVSFKCEVDVVYNVLAKSEIEACTEGAKRLVEDFDNNDDVVHFLHDVGTAEVIPHKHSHYHVHVLFIGTGDNGKQSPSYGLVTYAEDFKSFSAAVEAGKKHAMCGYKTTDGRDNRPGTYIIWEVFTDGTDEELITESFHTHNF